MIKSTVQCKDCVKQDVCGLKEKYARVIETVSDTLISAGTNQVLFARDDESTTITVSCNKYLSIKQGTTFTR